MYISVPSKCPPAAIQFSWQNCPSHYKTKLDPREDKELSITFIKVNLVGSMSQTCPYPAPTCLSNKQEVYVPGPSARCDFP
uniref:Uncharacterized protein n=1 Tax=Romanomermis culicivorax TaxID=13658 RepID=A0A915KX94_ROMCU